MAFLPICDKPFAWCDTETTGLDPNQNEIIDIAIVRVELDGSETVFESKVRMDRPDKAHPKALEVNGYTEEKWAGAPSSDEVFREICQRGLLQDCIIAGHNVTFDIRFIEATLKRLGLVSSLYSLPYDTMTLAVEHLKPHIKSVSLVNVCKALGIPTEGAHGAMADCRMAQRVHQVLTSATPDEKARWASEIPARMKV
jgi:DNA polymerase III subunit epsilon